jgi:NAD(P)-dependent dehydrogenase (short-subunit alcohol dehydrogenase family)
MGMPEERIKTMEEAAAKSSPIGILGKPEDIANTVAFLASDDAVFITGTNMLVDGGIKWTDVQFKLE